MCIINLQEYKVGSFFFFLMYLTTVYLLWGTSHTCPIPSKTEKCFRFLWSAWHKKDRATLLLGSYNSKRSPKWQWLKDRHRKGKACEKENKEKKSMDQSENLRWNKHAPFLASPNLYRAGSWGNELNIYKERTKRAWGLSFGAGPPSHPDGALSLVY